MAFTFGSWRGGFGAVRSAGIYDGTEIDLTQDAGAFAHAGFDDSSWTPVGVVPVDRAVLVLVLVRAWRPEAVR